MLIGVQLPTTIIRNLVIVLKAKIYKSPHGDSPASTMNPATFSPAPELQILRDKAGFKCFTLDWSRVRAILCHRSQRYLLNPQEFEQIQ